MKNVEDKVDCPNCGHKIIIPVMTPLRMAKLEEDYDMLEISAQEQSNDLWLWLHSVSLWGLLKFWLRRMR